MDCFRVHLVLDFPGEVLFISWSLSAFNVARIGIVKRTGFASHCLLLVLRQPRVALALHKHPINSTVPSQIMLSRGRRCAVKMLQLHASRGIVTYVYVRGVIAQNMFHILEERQDVPWNFFVLPIGRYRHSVFCLFFFISTSFLYGTSKESITFVARFVSL